MYLIAAENFPITARQVRADLGLQTTRFDPVINAAIASICIMSTGKVREETWAIRDGEGFNERVKRQGRAIRIGPARRYSAQDPHDYRDCTFRPDRKAVSKARKNIVEWCRRQDDIAIAMFEEQHKREAFVRKTPVTAALVVGLAAALDLEGV